MRTFRLLAAASGCALLCAAASAQDTCATAVTINLNDVVMGSTTGASGSLGNNDPGCTTGDTGNNAEDHWYVFTPAATAVYTIDLCGSTFDTSMSLFEGGCPPTVNFFYACVDDACNLQSRITDTLVGGTAYYIRIAGWGGASGDYTLRVYSAVTAAPANDACANATPIGFNQTVTGTNDTATTDGFASCPADGSNLDVWYSFSPPATGQYVVSLCGTEFDSVLAVFESPCLSGMQVACNDDGGCGFGNRVSQVTALLSQGTTYLIRISAWDVDAGGRYTLRVTSGDPPPANDDCANAVAVAALPFTDSVNTVFASPDGPPGSCNALAATALENSVWYTYTPASNETVEFLVDAPHDQLVSVFSGPDCNTLTEVRCHDEDDVPVNFFLDLTGGTTYWLGVGEYGAEGGGATDVTIRAIQIGACCTTGGCAVMTDLECAAAGGAFQGGGSSCATGAAADFTRVTAFGEVLLGPDGGTVSTDSQIVSGAPASIGNLDLGINLLHTFPGDLHIDLIHVASNTTVRVWEENCLFAAMDMDVTYSDAASPLTCADPLTGITARPLEALAAFNGLDPNGEWRLRLVDQFDGDGGELISWTLSISAADPSVCGLPPCACELDGNAAQVDVFDLLAFLDLWFANDPGADIDGVAGVDVFDLLAFLDCWFPASAGAPCP